jgi:cytoskeletal protein CcmA (bactofilin family)
VFRSVPFVAALLALLALAAPAAASAASTGAHADDAVVVISGDVTVHRGETVDGVYIANGDVRIAGRVHGNVVVLSGDALVSGTIEGDLLTADGRARLLPSAEVTGDLHYGSERPRIALDARVRGSIGKQEWPDVGGLFSWVGGFLVWLAVSVSTAVLGLLLLLISPRAADSIHRRTQERIGPVIAIGIAILIVLPIAALISAVTILGLPLALGIGLALLPLGMVAYVVAAWALGRMILKPPRQRALSFLAGIAIVRVAALVPFLGLLVDLAALVAGLGLIGAAIGAAREPTDPDPARSPGI